MQNPDIARIFDEVADLLEIQNANPFRVRAYRTAARTVRDFPEPLSDIARRDPHALTELPGIGEDLADKIRTIVATGSLPLHRQLAHKVPHGVLDLLRIPSLGPKRAKLLHAKLGIRSPADLRRAIQSGRLTKLKGFGARMIEKLASGLGEAEHAEHRLLLHEAEAYAQALVSFLKQSGEVEQIDVAGSYRRRKETIGDLDILVTGRPAAMDRFAAFGDIAQVISRGATRATVKLKGGVQVDLRLVEPAAYGAALLYFTGSKPHNIELRALAQSRKLKLNEYGLFAGTRRVAGKTEQEVYDKLKLDWIPPELREARGEIALAAAHRLPRLVALADIRGDLQMHTRATDGHASVAEMASAARDLGYTYVAITDHSRRVTMAHGLDPARLRKQWHEIDAWNAAHRGFTVLKGVEVDILEHGALDLPDDVLAEADYVVASLHYGLDRPDQEITRQLVAVARHPWVDAIGHPTGRLLGERQPSRFDFDTVARAAAEAGCLLEINGHPDRMDLPDTLAAAAKRLGVRFVLSTDSHYPGHLPFMRYAVDIARRAGLEAGDVVNTLPLEQLRRALKRAKGQQWRSQKSRRPSALQAV
ncbi:MAG TPA: DNA polymerase/3'-5' exonuclease PolX [Gemmatimonadales bacterium]